MTDPYEPRKFFSPNGYCNSARLASVHRGIELLNILAPEQLGASAGITCRSWVSVRDGGMISYLVDKDIGEQLKKSDLPSDMKLADIMMPHDAFIVCPHHSLIRDKEVHASFIEASPFTTIQDGLPVPGILVVAQMYRNDGAGEMDGMSYAMTWLRSMSTPMSEANIPMTSIDTDVEMNDTEHNMMSSAVRVILGAAMILSNYREMVSTGPCVRKIKAREGGKIDLYEPRWIGPRDAQRRASIPGTGTHLSPSAHWRRGHWRRQRVGEGRKDNRMTWIRPSFINPKEESNEGSPILDLSETNAG